METKKPRPKATGGTTRTASHQDMDRWTKVCELTAQLKRVPTIDELWPILSDLRQLKRYSRLGPLSEKVARAPEEAPRWLVRLKFEGLRRRVGALLGTDARIHDMLGTVVEKAVAALDEVLDPATRPTDAREIKAVADAAVRVVEIAGRSHEEKGGGGVHITNVTGIPKEESATLRDTRRRLHEAEQRAVGLDGRSGIEAATGPKLEA